MIFSHRHSESFNGAGSRRLAESNRCFLPRQTRQRGECDWCGSEDQELQEHPVCGWICSECANPQLAPDRPPNIAAAESWIYFIQAGGPRGPVKIGIATNPHERMMAFQTGNHLRLRLVRRMRGTVHDERALQTACRPYRVRGEWFRAEVLEALARHPLWSTTTEAVAS